jgi:hypothetical protein
MALEYLLPVKPIDILVRRFDPPLSTKYIVSRVSTAFSLNEQKGSILHSRVEPNLSDFIPSWIWKMSLIHFH